MHSYPRASYRHLPTVVCLATMHDADEFRAPSSVVPRGGLLKDADRSDSELALKTVCRGETYVTSAMAGFTLDAYCRKGAASAGPLGKLTARQREILQLIAEGSSTKKMAHRLDLSVTTVETHRAQLMERLEVHDVPGLVRPATRPGLTRNRMSRLRVVHHILHLRTVGAFQARRGSPSARDHDTPQFRSGTRVTRADHALPLWMTRHCPHPASPR